MRVRRRDLQAYLIGAGVAGTGIVVPYVGRPLLRAFTGEILAENVPFFLLPIVWGFWNWLFQRVDPAMGAGAWGALLGVVVSVTVNLLLWTRATWTPLDALLLVWLPLAYAVLWAFLVEPLNRA